MRAQRDAFQVALTALAQQLPDVSELHSYHFLSVQRLIKTTSAQSEQAKVGTWIDITDANPPLHNP